MDEITQDFLAHYGVKGMKWGVRKARPKSSSKPRARKRIVAKRRKRVKDMSDEELKKRIARLKMEKEYKELRSFNTAKGKSFVGKVLEKSGENVATQFTTYVMGTAVNKAFSDVFNDPSVVNPKKGQKDK